MRTLIAKLFHGLISRREFVERVSLLGLSAATADSIVSSAAPAGRREKTPAKGKTHGFRFEPYSQKTPYRQWIESEGVPVHTGYHIPDLRKLELGSWSRLGARGAHVVLEGGEGTDAAYVCELPPGESTVPQRYLFEEAIYVLDGEGETTVWHDRQHKQTFRWSKGVLFSPPLNIWRQHFNRGLGPVRFVSVTDLPIMMDLFHNAAFIFNNDFVFTDRYAGSPDDFACPPEKRRRAGTPGNFSPEGGEEVWECSLVPDVGKLELFEAEARGKGNRGAEIQLADNSLQCHISEFPVGTYKRAHRHGPGSHVVVVGGRGYSLMWKGDPRYSKSGKQVKVDWSEGSIFVPPDHWFHQHFNAGETPARYLAATWIGGKYFVEGLGGGGRTHRLGTVPIQHGGNMIDYPDEDPAIRALFEEELKKSGVAVRMSKD